MKMNYKELLRSWNPLYLRRRVAELEQQGASRYLGLMSEHQALQFSSESLVKDIEQLKEENERLEKEKAWLLHASKTNAVVIKDIVQIFIDACEQQYQNDKGDTH